MWLWSVSLSCFVCKAQLKLSALFARRWSWLQARRTWQWSFVNILYHLHLWLHFSLLRHGVGKHRRHFPVTVLRFQSSVSLWCRISFPARCLAQLKSQKSSMCCCSLASHYCISSRPHPPPMMLLLSLIPLFFAGYSGACWGYALFMSLWNIKPLFYLYSQRRLSRFCETKSSFLLFFTFSCRPRPNPS